jgi:hypothetical protein
VNAGGPYAATEGITLILKGHAIDADLDSLTYTWDMDYDGVGDLSGPEVGYAWPDNSDYVVTFIAQFGGPGSTLIKSI